MPEAQLAIAWFTAVDFEAALERWPDLIEWPVTDHADYSAHIEGDLRRYGEGGTIAVAPIRLDEYLPWCEDEKRDPSTSETRAHYAAVLAAEKRAIAWPPERNEACWCGRAQKYKWCCGRAPDRS
ncbi:MAG: hypothetical protein QOI61_2608 [Actinomycetota bacterium]|jgi:hypothetical protein